MLSSFVENETKYYFLTEDGDEVNDLTVGVLLNFVAQF